MNIKRIDRYDDKRFSKTVLLQHGAYEINGEPYEVEIIDSECAVIRGKVSGKYSFLAEEFRFHAPHIFKFIKSDGTMIFEFSPPEKFNLPLNLIQPSQFYVSSKKLQAIRSFIKKAEDIVIPVIRIKDRYVSLDGHTRLYLAHEKKWKTVRAVISETDEWIWQFIEEAEKRDIYCPSDLQLVSQEEYEICWNAFCDKIFGRKS
ncbi:MULTISPECIES: hypothetical protein [unclassified Treponema]|uniref:hypothetical protein n=1 Tax=unclassified Treponema TaxID=2638727 RepID=UPI0020A55605|nr:MULTISPECIES: hypothetical protein [unclassified Treponema]UTC66802.1 hypothetical protein E4O06_12775 [Treponema sp. OMZ 789]UTC69534.1 hypothetical protein E4O01_12910 [Treponema sp. OMZ 790]UTC72248.1 hypothetical protein E4O02_13005 [Treponema sp. OMZ 791]